MPVNVFGAGAVQTSYVAFRDITLNENTTLFWPNAFQSTANVMAAYMRVSTTATAGLIITLPNATQVSVGQNFIITNTSSNNFSINDNSGTDLGQIIAGISYYFILQDNSTPAGSWRRLTFGAGNSNIDAAEIAGLGLDAVAGLLNTNIPVVPGIINDYTVTNNQNASLLIWTGGLGNIILPDVGDVPDGFYFSVNNEGSGLLTLMGDKPIDNQASFVVGISQSLTVVKGGNNWWTLGFGQQTFFAVSVLNKDVGGNTNINLTGAEASRNIQQYNGVLTGDITVFFPVEANEWTIFNNTTGNFTLSVQLTGSVGTSYIVPQSNTQIFYSDGTTMRITPSILSPNAITFPSGTAVNPSITFTSDNNTGIYLVSPGTLGITSSSTLVADFDDSLINFIVPSTLQGPVNVSGSITCGTLNVNNATNLTNALTIPNGGTGQITAPAAIKALLPTATTAGTMIYYDGTNWVIRAPGTNGQVLTMVGGLPAWA